MLLPPVAKSLQICSANHDSEPPALRLTPIMCHLPCTAWQKVCSRPCGSTCTSSECTNMTPLVPIDVESVPRVTTPVPTAFTAQSPAPPTTTQLVERPSCFATAGISLPVTCSDS